MCYVLKPQTLNEWCLHTSDYICQLHCRRTMYLTSHSACHASFITQTSSLLQTKILPSGTQCLQQLLNKLSQISAVCLAFNNCEVTILWHRRYDYYYKIIFYYTSTTNRLQITSKALAHQPIRQACCMLTVIQQLQVGTTTMTYDSKQNYNWKLKNNIQINRNMFQLTVTSSGYKKL